jgi:hypothetical protein
MDILSIVSKIILLLIEIAVAVIVIPFIKKTVVPWLKEKHIYSKVQRFVRAAEKLGDTGAIDKDAKKAYVEELLMKCGITLTDEVLAMIESAVEELDKLGGAVLEALGGEVDAAEIPEGEEIG